MTWRRAWLAAAMTVIAACAESSEGGRADVAPVADVVVGDAQFGDGGFVPSDVVGADSAVGPDVAADSVDALAETTPPETGDRDNDGVPDAADPFPDDGTRPGIALDLTVYAHTEDTLFTMNVKTYFVDPVGAFDFPPGFETSEQMTDIAIDRWGVLWGVSFDRLWVCHPQTAECWRMGELPDSFNGLTWVPGAAISAGSDMLIGVANDGGWFRLSVSGGLVSATKLGSYGPNFTSSGDAFSIEGIGTFASVNETLKTDDRIVRIDPKTGGTLALVGTTPGLFELWGLAGWTERIFGFDASGAIVVIGLLDGKVTPVAKTEHEWWGAGVRSRL
ncbi:MAG: hypothetical protein R3F39_19390 [Myxococcota bacterium]